MKKLRSRDRANVRQHSDTVNVHGFPAALLGQVTDGQFSVTQQFDRNRAPNIQLHCPVQRRVEWTATQESIIFKLGYRKNMFYLCLHIFNRITLNFFWTFKI